MNGLDKRGIKLEQRLSSGEDHKPLGMLRKRPGLRDCPGKGRSIREATASVAIRADKIGIAETTGGFFPVSFTASPEIAAGETTEDSGAARLPPLPATYGKVP